MHWANSVAIGRSYDAMLRERYREILYKDLCQSFDVTARHVLAFIDAADIPAAIEKMRPSVYKNSVNKYLTQPKQKVKKSLRS
jgi:hypothetical protein